MICWCSYANPCSCISAVTVTMHMHQPLPVHWTRSEHISPEVSNCYILISYQILLADSILSTLIFTSVLIFTLLFAFFQVFKGYAQNIKHGVERQGDTDFGPFALAVLGATGIALAGLAQQTGALDGLLQGKN